MGRELLPNRDLPVFFTEFAASEVCHFKTAFSSAPAEANAATSSVQENAGSSDVRRLALPRCTGHTFCLISCINNFDRQWFGSLFS